MFFPSCIQTWVWKYVKIDIFNLSSLSFLSSLHKLTPFSIFLCAFLQFSPFVQPCGVFFSFLFFSSESRAEPSMKVTSSIISAARGAPFNPSIAMMDFRVTTRFLLETRFSWEESEDCVRVHTRAHTLNVHTHTHTHTCMDILNVHTGWNALHTHRHSHK